MKRIGYACKWVNDDISLSKKQVDEIEKSHNTTSINDYILSKSPSTAEDRIITSIKHNISATKKQLQYVSKQNQHLKMLRISSDLLPLYTHKKYNHIYKQEYVVNLLEKLFSDLGEYARTNDIRISMHPGQFTVLASDKEEVVNNSIKEFEYHAYMLSLMGYGKKFQDAKCNVHLSGRGGEKVFRNTFKKLSPEARNIITIENDETQSDLEACLKISDLCPIVMDVHHEFVHNGIYLQPNADIVKRVIDSWKGVRPTMHYAYSREIENIHDINTLPNMNTLLNEGYKKQKLRAHSDHYPNLAVNSWVYGFWDNFDIMCEAKKKNIASKKLFEIFNTMGDL